MSSAEKQENLRQEYEPGGKSAPDGLHVALYAVFFSGLIFCLIEYGRMPFETMGLFFIHLALAFFGAVLWVMQKVKLFNWQSLLTTIAYGIYAYFYHAVEGTEPITTMAITAQLISGWIFIMLLTDLAVTGRIRINKKFFSWTFALLAITTVCTLIDRNGNLAPIAYFYFIALCFIPITGREWKKLLSGLFIAGFLTFAAVSTFSYIGDPFFRNAEEIFLTRANLSQFYAMILALAVYGIFHAKDKSGRFSPLYVFFAGWTLLTVIMILIKGCTSAFAGIFLAVFAVVLFAYRTKPLSKFFIRMGITLAVVVLLCGGIYFWAKKASAPGFDADKFDATVHKAPLSYLGSTSDDISNAVYGVQFGSGYVDGLIKPNTPGALFNLLTDSRVDLIPMVAPMIGWGGHVISASGDNSFILSLRNQYMQYLYEFGFFAGGLNILLFVAMWIAAIIKYVKTSRIRYLFPIIVLAMTLGTWMNVSSGVLYPLGFIAMFSMLPVLVDLKTPKKKVMKVTVVESTEVSADDETADESTAEMPADEEDADDMVEGKNFIAAKFFSQNDDEEAPKKSKKKAKPVEEEEDDEEDGEIGRPTDRKKLEDVKIMNTAELSGLLTSEEIEEEKAPTLNAAGEITEEILTMEELDSLRKLSDETDKEIEEYISTKENEDE